jgi:hypothetical protein
VGILRGPGVSNLDFGLSKDFRVTEQKYFTFRIEAFNVLNHPNYGLSFGYPTAFGRIQSTFSPPRIVELVGKFTY